MEKIIHLETLTCPSCVKKIEKALRNVSGVRFVEVKFNSSRVFVEYDDKVVDDKTLESHIEALGFSVEK